MISNKNFRESLNMDYQVGKILQINKDDNFIMSLIDENIDELLTHTDNKVQVERILRRTIRGFIILGVRLNGDYYIRGLIVYRHQIIPGLIEILLLFGSNVKMRERLITTVMNFLKDTKDLVIYADSYNNDDSYVYMELGYKYNGVKMKNTGYPLYVRYVYEK